MLPDAAYAAALASVEELSPVRVRRLLEATTAPAAWARVVGGARWGRAARKVDVAAVWRAQLRAGVEVLVLGEAPFPVALAEDPGAPAVLFALGDPSVLGRHRRVAVVGTRRPTRYGLGVASQVGAELSAAGVAVMSGMAPGIEAAAHEAAAAAHRAAPATSAPSIGLVAGGLDDPHAPGLQGGGASAAAVVLSASPVGSSVPRWRLALRQRLLATLADVVVVVECHVRGSALEAARAAAGRGIAVGAVPGSVRSPASAGTNDLLADGCFVVRDVADVLVAVGMATAADPPARRPSAG